MFYFYSEFDVYATDAEIAAGSESWAGYDLFTVSLLLQIIALITARQICCLTNFYSIL